MASRRSTGTSRARASVALFAGLFGGDDDADADVPDADHDADSDENE